MRILALDPGETSGWAYSTIDDEGRWRLDDVWVTHDGVDGVSEMYHNHGYGNPTHFIVERFVVRPNQPVDPVALEVIGFVKGTNPNPSNFVWRLRSDKGKKGVMDAVLKKHDLWYTGKMVEHTDGRDVNDAIIHTLTWLCFKEKHQPTIDRFFPDA